MSIKLGYRRRFTFYFSFSISQNIFYLCLGWGYQCVFVNSEWPGRSFELSAISWATMTCRSRKPEDNPPMFHMEPKLQNRGPCYWCKKSELWFVGWWIYRRNAVDAVSNRSCTASMGTWEEKWFWGVYASSNTHVPTRVVWSTVCFIETRSAEASDW